MHYYQLRTNREGIFTYSLFYLRQVQSPGPPSGSRKLHYPPYWSAVSTSFKYLSVRKRVEGDSVVFYTYHYPRVSYRIYATSGGLTAQKIHCNPSHHSTVSFSGSNQNIFLWSRVCSRYIRIAPLSMICNPSGCSLSLYSASVNAGKRPVGLILRYSGCLC